jgi:hypothetical protein
VILPLRKMIKNVHGFDLSSSTDATASISKALQREAITLIHIDDALGLGFDCFETPQRIFFEDVESILHDHFRCKSSVQTKGDSRKPCFFNQPLVVEPSVSISHVISLISFACIRGSVLRFDCGDPDCFGGCGCSFFGWGCACGCACG